MSVTDAYPLDHWAGSAQPLSPAVEAALRHALDGTVDLRSLGGGNHDVFVLDVDGASYCLKRAIPSDRPDGSVERVIEREVGGMLTVGSRVPDRCPRPLAWGLDPAFVLCELLPGADLGNVCLSADQLDDLADGSAQMWAITPDSLDQRLWDIDWPIEWLVQKLSDAHALLLDRCERDEHREAAALLGSWLDSDGPQHFLEPSDRLVFSRGDQNLANAIWDGQRVRFVDFEYCGWNDLPRDLSLSTDHIQSYATPVEVWDELVERIDLTVSQRRRLLAGRRRCALSWLTKECLNPGSLHGVAEQDRLPRLLDRARTLCSRKS